MLRFLFGKFEDVLLQRTSRIDLFLDAIEPGVIPADQFYVQGTHEMSFDPRYRVNGLVRREQIIGKATVLF